LIVSVLDEWHPVTSDIGLIQAPVEQIRTSFLNWRRALGEHHEEREVHHGLSHALDHLAPLSSGKRRRLFLATRSGWTAQFQSGIQGSDPFPVMSHFAKQLGVLAMRICSTPSSAIYPATIWEVYAPAHLGGDTLGYRRSLAAANDGGRWIFEESGEPFPFEQEQQYALPRKRDRFTRRLLAHYAAEFDVFPFDDDFYLVDAKQPGILLERPAWANEPPEFSLEEVKRGLPWKGKR
jgi:hypothetical protein